MYEKLKSFLLDDTTFAVLMVLLVGLGSFGLGRLSVLEFGSISAVSTNSTALLPLSALETTVDKAVNTETPVVASRSGTKYHLPTCPGAQQIKPENKIEFASITLAEAAGYTRAANCPDLPE